VIKDYMITRDNDVMFDVIARMSHKGLSNVLVVKGDRLIPRVDNIVGIITKDRIAESVGESLTYRTA